MLVLTHFWIYVGRVKGNQPWLCAVMGSEETAWDAPTTNGLAGRRSPRWVRYSWGGSYS